jgi:hypothetical protein
LSVTRFLFIPAFQDRFLPSVIHIGGRDVPDSFVIAAMIVIIEFGADGEGSFRWSHSRVLFDADLAGAAF